MEEEEVLSKKQRNTFKFQGFNEHKERIKLALLRNQLFPIKLDSDTDTKCAAALEKWTELNSTTEYVAFRRDVEVFVQSLEILVLHKDDVIATFKEALQNSSIESLQPIMEFGVALCFDLSEAMQWEFGSLVSIYTGLLSRHSAASSHQALEHAFTGISYTLYALRRQLRRQPDEAAIQLKPLLLTGGHVTELAAESFAFLLRKLPNQSYQLTARLLDLLASWLDSAAASDDADLMTEAVSGTVFYWLRGAAGQLAAGQFQTVYPRLIDWLIDNQELPATREIRLRCLTLVHVRLLRHARRGDNSDAAIEPIRRQLLDRLAGGSASNAAELVARLLLGEFDDCYSKKNRRQALVLSQALIGGKGDPERWCRCVEKLSNNQSTWSKSVARLTAGLTRYFCQSSDGTSKITVDHCLEDNFCQRLFRCCRLSTWTLPGVDADNSEIWRRRFEFVQLVGGAGVGDEAGSDSGSLGRRFLRLALPMLAEAVCLGGAEAFEQLGAFCLAPASGCWRAPAESFEAVPAEDRLIDWAECGSEEKVLTELSSTIDRLASSADGFLCNRLALCCSFLPMSKFASESSLASVLDKLVNLTVRQLSNSSQTVALTLDQCQALFRCIYALLNLSADAVQLQNLISSLIDSLPCNCASPIYWKCIDFLLQFLSDRGDHLKLIFDNSNLANKLNSLAIDCLTSASHCVRLHCLRTLRQIVKQDANNPDDSVLLLLRCIESCLAAESLTVGIENLRECLRLLDGLDAERMAAASAAPSVAVSTLCCRYLLGLLRTQFTPLWTPIAKLLASHAAYAGSAFWSVLTSALTTANLDSASIIKDNAVETDDNGNDKQQKEEVAMETDSGDTVFINSFLDNEAKRLSYGQSSPSLERIDPLTYRLQLWRCLRVLSPQLVAKRTAVTSPLILACLRNGEFCPSPNREPWIIRRRCQATLVAMLDLYSGLGKAVKCVSGEAELHRWYYSLLQCSAAQVRKAALRCIIAYGDKTLAGKPAAASSVDWIGFLHRLSDFKSTKEALVSIGGDLSEASELQRQAVLAVAMRLLLGRVRSGGGAGGQLQCIFAFLEESCQPEERRSFLNQLLFDQFAGLSLDNVSSIEIDSDVSIGRLQAAAKCALLVLSSMRLDASELCKLYSLLLCFCALLPRLAASLAANNTTSVSRIASSQLRGLRQACQKAVLRALESGSDRLLTERLIDDTFKHCVEPHLPRLATEAATAGTPGLALRLLQIWSADNRHDRLLEGQPIQSLAELLGNANSPSNGSVSEPVLLACLSIFNNLLGEEADSTAPIEAMQADNRKLSRPHYLMPVADSLASFVSNRLSPGRLEASIDVSREALRLLALLVDNGLYRAEACEKLAGTLLRLLLLPMDGKKSKSSKKKVGGGIGGLRSDEFQARLLAALLTLLKRAASPCRTLFLQAFTLFSKLTHRSSRILLCQIAEAAVSKLGLVSQPLGELANDLNAWDKRHIEMPDFERRERGHQSALTIVTALTAGPSLSSSSLSGWSQLLNNRLETLLIAEHCALHTLAHVTDGPLRLLASELLQSLIAALAGLDIASTNAADRDESEARSRVLNMLLWRSVWPAIAQGVKMDENRRVEYIGLLGKIVTEFGHHARLQGLAGLLPSAQQQQQQQQASADASAASSTSASVNDSFFDNVRSVNSARIVKGFRQLITYLASPRGDCIPANLLYHYLLPLPMHYLHKSGRSASAGKQQQQQQASNRRSLIESSLELLASISSRLSWPMLQQLLKLCLKGLDGPATESKLPVRLAVAALSGLGEIGEVDEDDQLEIEPEAASKQSGNRKRRLRFFQQSVPVSNIFATVKRAKKLSPEVNNGRPEVTNSKSEVTNGKPEVTKGEPEVTIGEPEVTKGEPEMTNRKLEVTKGEPEVTNGEPEVTNEEPEASNSATRSMGGSGPLTFLIEFVCPRLERHLSRDKTAAEQQHRLAPRQEPQVLQVSVAVALAQLLAKLPRRLRDQRLPKLVYRLAEFLRSREHAVRKEAGATLVRVVQLLGNDYLGFVARELSLLLARGYTRHVLAHTLHSLLRHCQAAGMPTGCLDGETLDRLCRIYMDELLGDLSKEKEVEALTRKLPEAQRTHAYSVMHRLGSMVGPTGLAQLTNILANQCSAVRSLAALKKLERLCGQLERADSLPGNSGLTDEQLLTAAHLLCRRAGDEQNGDNNSKDKLLVASGIEPAAEHRSVGIRGPDCRLLDPEPARSETRPAQLGSYQVLLRFGLRLLYAVLRNASSKSDSESGKNKNCSPISRRMLDPFVPILLSSLDSQHTAVLTAALQCLSRLVPLHQLAATAAADLDKGQGQSSNAYRPIAKRVLALFNEQSLHWSTRQQLQQPSQLQQLLHKTLAVLIRHDALSQPDLVTIVDYIALDVDSPHRASHAFPLLRALLAKRLNPKPQLRHELDVETEKDHASLSSIMDSLRSLVVTSALDYVRSQSRDCLLIYLRDYQLPAKTVRRYLDFFLVQLDYDGVDGRSSAVQMLASLIHCISADWLVNGDLARVLFLKLLVAADSECNDQLRARLTDCLHGLLRRCGADQRRELFASALRLMRTDVKQLSQRVVQQRLGLTAALSFFEYREVETESGDEENWSTVELHTCLAELLKQLADASLSTAEHEQKPKSLKQAQETDVVNEAIDHALFRCVDLLARCPNALQLQQVHTDIWSLLESLLNHRFAWVRRRCLQLVANRLAEQSQPAMTDTDSAMSHCRTLALAFFDQLKSPHLDEAWSDDVARALVHLCCRVHQLELGNDASPATAGLTGADKGFSTEWILLRVGRESRYELQHLKPSTLRRCLALKVCAGVASVLGGDALESSGCLRRCLAVAARELRQRNASPEVTDLAHSLLDTLRRGVGESAVASALAQLTRSRAAARSDRAGSLAAAAVTQPEVFARRKRRKQQKKAEAAKAKIAKFKLARRGGLAASKK